MKNHSSTDKIIIRILNFIVYYVTEKSKRIRKMSHIINFYSILKNLIPERIWHEKSEIKCTVWMCILKNEHSFNYYHKQNIDYFHYPRKFPHAALYKPLHPSKHCSDFVHHRLIVLFISTAFCLASFIQRIFEIFFPWYYRCIKNYPKLNGI